MTGITQGNETLADTNTQRETPIFPPLDKVPVTVPVDGRPVTVPVQNSEGESVTVAFGTMSTDMPPKDVTDAAMLLTEVCTAWTPTELPTPNTSGPPQPPIFHNPSYVQHRDLCTLATDPVGFSKKMDNAFEYGMIAAVLLIVLAYLAFRFAGWVRKLFSRRKQRSAEALKARLLVEAAKAKVDDINRRQAPGAAE